MQHSEFPSDETLAAFIDGRVDQETRRRVIEHIAECPDCYSVFLGATEMRGASADSVVRFPRRRAAGIGLLAAAAAVAVILFVPPIRERVLPQPKRGLAALAEAAPPQRNIEGRLTGFPYRPLAPVTRGPGDQNAARNPENWKLLSVAARVQDEAKKNPTPENLHALGVSHLLLGNWDEAVGTLEEALKKETGEEEISKAIQKSNDAALLNDLSAAYYARGRAKERAQDFLAAAESAERGFAIQKSPSTAFNRAVAVEAIHGRAKAYPAWNEYLRLEPSSAWSSEARGRLGGQRNRKGSEKRSIHDELQAVRDGESTIAISQLVRRSRFEATRYVMEQLLPEWSAAARSGDIAGAQRSLEFAQRVGQAVADGTGDQLIIDSVRAINNSKLRGDADALGALANAHAAYATGRQMYRAEDITSALRYFDRARNSFRRGASPAEALAWNYNAGSLVYASQYAAAQTDIRAAISRFSALRHRYPAAIGQLYWTDGVVKIKSGLPQEALESYKQALNCFERAEQSENIAAVHSLIAECYEFVGDREQAWSHRRLAIQTTEQARAYDRLYVILDEAAQAAAAGGYYYSASRFQDSLVADAIDTHDPFLIAEAFTRRASGRMLLHSYSSARDDLKAAHEYSGRVPDPVRRARLSAEVNRADADIEAVSDPKRALDLLEDARRLYVEIGDRFRVGEVHLQRGKIEERLGLLAGAESDYRNGIAELEHLRLDLNDPSVRGAYFASSGELFDHAIALTWHRRDYASAFLLAERSRARALLDFESGSNSHAPVLGVQELMHRLPPGACVVEYAFVPGKLLTWIVSARRLSTRELLLTDAECVRMRQHLEKSDTDAGYTLASASLYDALIRPLSEDLETATTITFVPNKSLTGVPFAGLFDHSTASYLVQRFQIGVAPSATVYAHSLATDESIRNNGVSVVLVGNPRGIGTSAPLTHVTAEMSRIAEIYPRHVLLRQDLTKQEILGACAKANVVHFAGHAFKNDRYPSYASLLVAAENGVSHLYAHEIIQQRFRQTRMIVLSACGTQASSGANEAALGISESFLAAGVPTVVAATRPVEDESTSRILYAFHAAFMQSGNAIAALQSAQLQMICEGHSPREWSSWQLIGGCRITNRRNRPCQSS